MSDFRLWDETCEVCGVEHADLTEMLREGLWVWACPDCYARHWFESPVRSAPGTYERPATLAELM